MKVKTSDLAGPALDWAVAKCLHGNLFMEPYSADWAQGGPIIEREKIMLLPHLSTDGWVAESFDETNDCLGPTPLIAAMRCYVASKLGDAVEVPDELTTQTI